MLNVLSFVHVVRMDNLMLFAMLLQMGHVSMARLVVFQSGRLGRKTKDEQGYTYAKGKR